MSLLKFPKPSSFASAERAEPAQIGDEAEKLRPELERCTVLEILPDPVAILNINRQIVFANRSLLAMLKLPDDSLICGMRPGEALHCVHAENDSGGCGTTEFCRFCGAVNAILETQQFHTSVSRDCHILTTSDNANNLRIWTSPFVKHGCNYTLMVVRDIADEVYRHSLERIFFHDIINIGSGLAGLLSIIDDDPDAFRENRQLLTGLTEELLEEIHSQRDLLAAESGAMNVKFSRIKSFDIIKCVTDMLARHQAAENKSMTMDDSSENIEFETDPSLLKRILINVVKNALEACPPGAEVVLKSSATGGKAVFEVHNPGRIPDEVRLQIFNRAFSTKGQGRGLGTYSARLLGEKYLRGKVYFTSSEELGTSFFLELPLSPEAAGTAVSP